MKIKVIDLFKLMLERKAPKKIRVLGIDMTFIETAEWGDYKDDNCFRLSEFRLIDFLNEDVEIIEESKKIEKIDEILMIDDLIPPYGENEYKAWKNIIIQQNKINELIDEINNLKEK